MTPRRTVEIRTLVRALLIGAGLGAGLGLGAPGQAAAVADGSLLQPTPLILKDGRIANVSVLVLSFSSGQSVLGEANAQRLESLSAEFATDCFLTAQVIGHVGSTEVGNDTLGAHRLARARADAVQASLIADGLPAKAIASVWDWQFMVREPRATLWVFRLTPGEDCEGKPLEPAAPALVAGEPSPVATPISDSRPAAKAASEARPEPVSSRDGGPGPAAPAASATNESRAEPASSRDGGREPAAPAAVIRAAEAPASAVAVPAGPAQAPARVPTVTQALPAVSPKPAMAVASQPDAAPATGQPEAEPAAAGGKPAAPELPQVIAALPERAAESPAEPAAAGADELVITFPNNSSYFPPGAGTQLQKLLRQLSDDGNYQVVLQASVSGSEKVVGAESPEEAAKYNQWLAERRVDRVRSWLDQNAAGKPLPVKPEYRANDESRQVVIRVVPGA